VNADRGGWAVYPSHLADTGTLRDGTLVSVRPIHAADLRLEHDFVAGLSSQTRYERLLSARRLLPGELRRLTRVDYRRDMALVAQRDDNPALLGVARYVRLDDPSGAEIALVVGDAWQGRGLGELLLRMLLDAARQHDLDRLEGLTLSTNLRMLALARKLGFSARRETQDATLTGLSCRLAPARFRAS